MFGLAIAGFAARLFVVQVLSHEFYSDLADSEHTAFRALIPERGVVFFHDPKAANGVFPAAINRPVTLVYAVPHEIGDSATADAHAKALAPVLGVEEAEIRPRLEPRDDPYEPLGRIIDEQTAAAVRELHLKGIGFAEEARRFYPDGERGSQLLGFVGSDERGTLHGRYGVEGYWDEQLAGQQGFLASEKDPFGRLIGAARNRVQAARDGVSLTLTIDRTIQYVACDKLKAAVQKHGASGGTVIIADPHSGAVLAMCNAPAFDPNAFSQVADVGLFNNPAVFSPYEPGSVFKSVTLAAAIDAGKVSPNTTYVDEGSVKIGLFTIKNSDGKGHGLATMTDVLAQSLNTGTIFVERQIGTPAFRDYVAKFGFGAKTGVDIAVEATGSIASLDRRGDIWGATASFGQGISVTPLQLVAAYGAIANGGTLMKPYVVDAVTDADGKITRIVPTEVRRVIASRTASLISGMLVRVVEEGHGNKAGVPGYFVAGKTGTAQIPRRDGQGYEEGPTIGTFVGFAPVDDPKFVMLTKIDRPQDVDFAESSAAPLFGDIANFLLHYLEVPPERK